MASSEQIEETAADWLARKDSDRWTEADERRLEAWLSASTAHRVAYLRLSSVWQHTGRLKALARNAPVASVPVTAPPASRRKWHVSLAAGLVLAVGLVGAWHALRQPSASYDTVIGGIEAVPLSDGSRVTLNTDSRIRVVLTPVERRIELLQGEAFFEVARDPSRPFVVYAGERKVVATGTAFSVRRSSDEVKVIVTHGSVRVEPEQAGAIEPIVRLSAGNVARASDGGVLVVAKTLPEVEEFLSWRTGFVVFHDTALAEVVAEFNRYNARRIVIEDPEVAAIRFGGSFRSTNVEAFVRLVERGFPIQAEQQDSQVILRSR